MGVHCEALLRAHPGLSFTANELFQEIRKHYSGFGFRVELDENMNKFANLWPDELSKTEALRDLNYAPEVGLSDMVKSVLGAHNNRNLLAAAAFKTMDTDGSGLVTRDEMEKHVRKYLVRGREQYGRTGQGEVKSFVDKLMKALDTNSDGVVSWTTFSEWSRSHSMEQELWNE